MQRVQLLTGARAAASRVRRRLRPGPPPPPAPPPPPSPEELAFPDVHDRADHIFRRALRGHPHLPDRESRLCELIEYFGWEVGHRAVYATPWFYEDDPRNRRYIEALGVDPMTFQIQHMYSLFNRMDPEAEDLFWIYDGLAQRLEELGGRDAVSVLDFGCGLGQCGLAFCLAGYRTVMSDRVPQFLDFVRFLADNRNAQPVLHRAETEHTYYDTAADEQPFGVVIEWSAFEHVADAVPALEKITGGLLPGGMFVTTTFKKDWTPELIAHYRRDSLDEAIAEEYLSPEVDAWLDERFDVLSPPRTIAKVLVKR